MMSLKSFTRYIPIRYNSKILNYGLHVSNKISSKYHLKNVSCRFYSAEKGRAKILGIETSCDDTGCAIIDESGNILGEAIHSQLLVHLRNGGVIPPIAQDLHREFIEPLVEETFYKADMTGKDIDAIAVTVKPGLPLSLKIGFKYAKYLSKKYSKPIIPIHHMQAHALTVRMDHDVKFPYLCLLISGGHCLLTLINAVDDFKLMGESLEDAPGEAFDKAARQMKLRNIEEFSKMSGGQAIEILASRSDNPGAFNFTLPLTRDRDCNFSMAGMKSAFTRHLLLKERLHGIEADGVIPEVNDLCAGLLIGISRHLCHRTLRAMQYIEYENLIPEENRVLVVSGGVACNNYIFKCLELVCKEMGYTLKRPPSKLCTDNGIMIAWNGVEKWRKNIDITYDIDTIETEGKCPLGVNISDAITNREIATTAMKLKCFYEILKSD